MGQGQLGKLGKLTIFACEKEFWKPPNDHDGLNFSDQKGTG